MPEIIIIPHVSILKKRIHFYSPQFIKKIITKKSENIKKEISLFHHLVQKKRLFSTKGTLNLREN